MARWIAEEGLSLDVCSAGELAVTRAADFPADRILMHGNGKTPWPPTTNWSPDHQSSPSTTAAAGY